VTDQVRMGSAAMDAAYVGSSAVDAIYLGTTQVYTAESVPAIVSSADYFWHTDDISAGATSWTDRNSATAATLNEAAAKDGSGDIELTSGTQFLTLPSGSSPAITATTGTFTVLVALTRTAAASGGQFWCARTSASSGVHVYPSTTTTMLARVRGTTGAVPAASRTWALGSSIQGFAGVFDAGTVYAYRYGAGLSAGTSYTGEGTWSNSTTPRVGSYGYTAGGGWTDGKLRAVLIWHQALTATDLDTVSAYLGL
jgi:hypothetical protein